MAIDLYVLKERALITHTADGGKKTVYFLQLVVQHALSKDSQPLVDNAVRYASMEWRHCTRLPELVVQVGIEGLPKPGSAIFQWPFLRRSYCFDHELPAPIGYLGEREILGYRFRSAREQACLNNVETARRIDEGSADVYRDFWHGVVFQSGEEFLRFQSRFMECNNDGANSEQADRIRHSPRASKILGLIRFIEGKGANASAADLNYLGSLRQKATQLGCLS